MKGLDTPTPFIQLSGTILKGAHNVMLGSELIFLEDTRGPGMLFHPSLHSVHQFTRSRSSFPEGTADFTNKPITYLANREQCIRTRAGGRCGGMVRSTP